MSCCYILCLDKLCGVVLPRSDVLACFVFTNSGESVLNDAVSIVLYTVFNALRTIPVRMMCREDEKVLLISFRKLRKQKKVQRKLPLFCKGWGVRRA